MKSYQVWIMLGCLAIIASLAVYNVVNKTNKDGLAPIVPTPDVPLDAA